MNLFSYHQPLLVWELQMPESEVDISHITIVSINILKLILGVQRNEESKP